MRLVLLTVLAAPCWGFGQMNPVTPDDPHETWEYAEPACFSDASTMPLSYSGPFMDMEIPSWACVAKDQDACQADGECFWFSDSHRCLDACGSNVGAPFDSCFACTFADDGPMAGGACPDSCATHELGYCGMPCDESAGTGSPLSPYSCYFCETCDVSGCADDWREEEQACTPECGTGACNVCAYDQCACTEGCAWEAGGYDRDSWHEGMGPPGSCNEACGYGDDGSCHMCMGEDECRAVGACSWREDGTPGDEHYHAYCDRSCGYTDTDSETGWVHSHCHLCDNDEAGCGNQPGCFWSWEDSNCRTESGPMECEACILESYLAISQDGYGLGMTAEDLQEVCERGMDGACTFWTSDEGHRCRRPCRQDECESCFSQEACEGPAEPFVTPWNGDEREPTNCRWHAEENKCHWA